MKRFIKKIIRALLCLWVYLLVLTPQVKALTACGNQGIEFDNTTMPLIIFPGNGEIRNFTYSDSATNSTSWSYQSFTKLCQVVQTATPSTFSTISFRIPNYTLMTNNAYTFIFSWADVNGWENIQPESLAINGPNKTIIVSSTTDPRDKVFYLSVTFYVTSNYSGAINFSFYIPGTSSLINNTAFFYSPYITSTPLVDTNSNTISSVKTTAERTLAEVQEVQEQNETIIQQNEVTNEKLEKVDESINSTETPEVGFDDVEVSSDEPISDLLTMPLTLVTAYYDAVTGTCTNYTLPFFYGENITFKCFTIGDYVGSTVEHVIDMAICLFMVYEMALLFIRMFDGMTTLSDTYTWIVKKGG